MDGSTPNITQSGAATPAPDMQFNVAGLRTFIAMPTHRDIPGETVLALMATQKAMLERGMPLEVEMHVGSSLVHHARTLAAWRFLKTNSNRLFWIDSDIVWSPDAFLRLLALSTKMEIVVGMYPTKKDPPTFQFNPHEIMQANPLGCFPIKGAGMGFCIVQRHVIEELSARAPMAMFPDINDDKPIPHVFRCDINADGYSRGEDMAFFDDARDLGYTVNMDPTIQLGHVGAKTYSGKVMDCFVKTSAAAAIAA